MQSSLNGSSNMATQTVPSYLLWRRAHGIPPPYTHRALIAGWCWTKICFFEAFYQRYSLFSLEWLQNKSASSFTRQLFRHTWALISLLFSWKNAPFSWYVLCNTSFSLSPAWTLGHVFMPQLKKSSTEHISPVRVLLLGCLKCKADLLIIRAEVLVPWEETSDTYFQLWGSLWTRWHLYLTTLWHI